MPRLFKKIKPDHIEYLADWFGYYANGVDSHVEEDEDYISLVFTRPDWKASDNISLVFDKKCGSVTLRAWKSRAASEGGPIQADMPLYGFPLWHVRDALSFAIRCHLLDTGA